MKFAYLPQLEQPEINKRLLSNFEDNNYNNCWCKIKYNDNEYVVRLVGYRNGYYSFFDYATHTETFLPSFQMLYEDEFTIIWVGKGKDVDDESWVFGLDKESDFKTVMNYRYDYGFSYCNCKKDSDSDSDSESESENISEYDCSDGELELL